MVKSRKKTQGRVFNKKDAGGKLVFPSGVVAGVLSRVDFQRDFEC